MIKSKECARILGICTRTLARYVSAGYIKAIKVGHSKNATVLFDEEEIERFKKEGMRNV